MSDGARGLVFGRSAGTYDVARPSYPREAIDHVLGLVGVAAAVEIGAGTGKATAGFAREGMRITCLEPDRDMAALLRARSLPGVEVVESSFEAWPGPAERVDLVYAAQAWHWLDTATSYPRVRSMLRSGGALALMWNLPLDRYGPFRDVYRELAPRLLAEDDERIRKRDSERWLDELSEASFRDTSLFRRRWSVELNGAETRRLYSTYSDHMMLPEPTRRGLLDAVEGRVGALGGSIALEYETRVFSGLS